MKRTFLIAGLFLTSAAATAVASTVAFEDAAPSCPAWTYYDDGNRLTQDMRTIDGERALCVSNPTNAPGGYLAWAVVSRPLISEKFARINQEVVKIFEHAETPVVLFDSDVEKKPRRSACDIVAVNNVDAGRSVAECLILGGRKRIAFNMVVCVDGRNENLDNRFFGVAGESVVRGLYDGVRPIRVNPTNAKALKKLMRSRWRPDAIVCGNDEIAVRLVETLKGMGVSIPRDVAVIGFDDVSCARQCIPPLSTVRQPSRQIAQALLKTLFFRMRSPDAPPQEIYLESPLVLRGTT